MLEQGVGKPIAKLVMLFLFVFLILKSSYFIKEFHYFLVNTLFSDLPFYFFVFPLIVMCVFLMNSSLRSLGRSSELFFPLVLIALIITLIIPNNYLSFANLLPILDNGIGHVLEACFRGSFSAGDFIIFIFLMGNIEYTKNSYKKIFRWAVASSFMVILFYTIFIAIFGNISVGSIMAIGEIPLFASFPSAVGRVDWVTINLWTIAALFQIGVLLNFALFSFNYVFNAKNKKLGITIISFILITIIYFVYLDLANVVQIITSSDFNKVNVIFQISLPVVAFISFLISEKKLKKSKKEKKLAVVSKVG